MSVLGSTLLCLVSSVSGRYWIVSVGPDVTVGRRGVDGMSVVEVSSSISTLSVHDLGALWLMAMEFMRDANPIAV